MPIKVFKPTSPGRRDMSGQTFEEITRSYPEPSLDARYAETRRTQCTGQDYDPPSWRWS